MMVMVFQGEEESEGEEALRNENVVFNPWRYDFYFFICYLLHVFLVFRILYHF